MKASGEYGVEGRLAETLRAHLPDENGERGRSICRQGSGVVLLGSEWGCWAAAAKTLL
jgi:hypothetical protein